MKVKYNDRENFTLIEDYQYINPSRVRLVGRNVRDDKSGFDVYDNNEVKLYTHSDYTVIYDKGDDYIDYTSDTNIYNVFDVFNSEKYVTSQLITTDKEVANALLRTSGQGKEYAEAVAPEYVDEEGFYNYKVVTINEGTEEEPVYKNIITEVTDEEKDAWREQREADAFESAKSAKLSEISNACKEAIVNGVTVGDSHYSYDAEDQNNISNATTLAIQTGLAVPYHADGESCRLFEKDEMVTIYVAEETNLTHNTTYHNQLKLYVQTLETIEEVEAIEYGVTELTGEYLETYNMIMAQAAEVIKKFIGDVEPADEPIDDTPVDDNNEEEVVEDMEETVESEPETNEEVEVEETEEPIEETETEVVEEEE